MTNNNTFNITNHLLASTVVVVNMLILVNYLSFPFDITTLMLSYIIVILSTILTKLLIVVVK
jgi:hypothetical protein